MFKRVYFTLMEIIIAISIIAMVSAVVGIGIVKARQQQRFNSAVQLVADKLQMAQDLMLLLKSDVKVQFSKDPKNSQAIICQIKVERDFTEGAKRLVNLNTTIRGISSVIFVDEQNLIHRDSFQLMFFSGGSKMSRGILNFYGDGKSNDESMHKQILLVGYPQPITTSNSRLSRLDPIPVEDVYPIEALQEWRAANAKANSGVTGNGK